MTTRSQVAATNVACLLRARTPLIWIVTREEARVEEYLVEAAKAAVYVPKFWDTAQGLGGRHEEDCGGRYRKECCIWVRLRWHDIPDGHTFIDDAIDSLTICSPGDVRSCGRRFRLRSGQQQIGKKGN